MSKEQVRVTNAFMRKTVYQYLQEQGFSMTPERHEAIHNLLAAYETDEIKVLRDRLSEVSTQLHRLKG